MTFEQDRMDQKQSDYALFLPALSSFYATYVGKQRFDDYVDPNRIPFGLRGTALERINWLNEKESLFYYPWSLYSAGHANLDLTKFAAKEDMVRNREEKAVIVCDSGGFQIAKGVWEGDWKDPNDPASSKKREQVLAWLDGLSNYAMTLDIPTWLILRPEVSAKTGIYTYEDAVKTTKFNNEYFIKNRKGWQNGGTKFLNVMQGANHAESDQWYEIMKEYCDPAEYPDRHFNGWAFGGQNMCDLHLMLRRIVIMIHDGLLEEGLHDWIHVLGTSKLEWAVLLTAIQRAVRKYHNPSLTISFDCASPFLASANARLYVTHATPDRGKWTYRMEFAADDKKYATDPRSFKDASLQDGIHKQFMDSPISTRVGISDICVYKPGDLNKIGKEGRTSWDSFSYALMMSHNVWMHCHAVQEANRQYDAGARPAMLVQEVGEHLEAHELIDRIFALNDRELSLEMIDRYSRFWTKAVGTRGDTGKRAINAKANFAALFDVVEPDAVDSTEELNEDTLDELEHTVDDQ